ncbi:hypothetical protein ACNOYE_24460 [Nannocystaceae bacterium ST9]
MSPATPAEPTPSLTDSLLHAEPAPSERAPGRRWSYPQWAAFVVSLFIAYHTIVLLVWNLPAKGLNQTFHKTTLDTLKGFAYFNGTRNSQSWAMFAPNPNRDNTFIKVFVEDQNGETWDFGQDIWGNERYPYLWYDRRGKVNRNLNNKKNNQQIYGAWVCREWERLHGGEPAKSVTFVRRYTMVPKPRVIIENGGWEPWNDQYKQKAQETITCKTTPGAQLPNELRERYGLPPIDEKLIRPIQNRTWVDTREAERKKAEREAKLAGRALDKPVASDDAGSVPGDVEEQEAY